MKVNPSAVPCMEPTNVRFRNVEHDVRLSGSPRGSIGSSKNRRRWEQWTLVPINSASGLFAIRSVPHGYFLSSDPDSGEVSTSPSVKENEIWDLERFSGEEGEEQELFGHGTVSFVSRNSGRRLGCDCEGRIQTIDSKGDEIKWVAEFLSGELCFMSSPIADRRVSCDFVGNLRMVKAWLGWEVWRFIETGDSPRSVYISSWTHEQFFLAISPVDGRVFTTKNPDAAEKWVIVKTSDGKGVIILPSSCQERVLATNGKRLYTTFQEEKLETTWRIEAANLGLFYLTSTQHQKRVGCDPSRDIYVTNNRRKKSWEKWRLQESGIVDGSIRILSCDHGTYLEPDSHGGVEMNHFADDCESLWFMEPLPKDGSGIVLRSATIGYEEARLSCNGTGVCTTENECGPNESWTLEPCMPRTIGGKEIGTIAATGLTTIGLAVAAPFAVIGLAGLAAEGAAIGGGALAAGGVLAAVGETAAVAAGLGVAGTTIAVGTAAIVAQKRKEAKHKNTNKTCTPSSTLPFCAWREW